jgi:hypothetical protein
LPRGFWLTPLPRSLFFFHHQRKGRIIIFGAYLYQFDRKPNKPMSDIKGFLDMKIKGTLTDSWSAHLCVFNPETKLMQVKSSDGKKVRCEKTIVRALRMAAKATRRQNRFDVETADGAVLAFAGSSKSDMEQWVKVSSSSYNLLLLLYSVL